MTVYVVTQSETDAAVLKAALKDVPFCGNKYKVIAAGGRTTALSYARSLLMVRKTPVVLVVDADTMNDSRSAELERYLNQSLSEAGPPTEFKVIVVRPEIERLLFADRDIVTGMFGTIADDDFIKGQYVPKTVLGNLLKGKNLAVAIEAPTVANRIQDLRVKELDELRSYVSNPLSADTLTLGPAAI
ncbi:MAG: hypothetical protein ACLQVD_18520 [Capsulimonadaceae bacterium]